MYGISEAVTATYFKLFKRIAKGSKRCDIWILLSGLQYDAIQLKVGKVWRRHSHTLGMIFSRIHRKETFESKWLCNPAEEGLTISND